MLIRNRLSRIFYLKKFFDYPVTLNGNTISNLGIVRIIRIGLSYIHIKIKPPKNIITLEDFLISRFGKELYKTFFKDYTEKVWGVPCTEIAADWGAQRIKELSVSRAIIHALKSIFTKETSIEQKNTDTSLIEQFMYPKLGPGQMWETVANIIKEKGGIIINNAKVIGLSIMDNKINEVIYIDNETNNESSFQGDYYFSTMAVKDLIAAMGDTVPPDIKRVSDGLQYRDFITVGLLLNNLKIKNKTSILTLYDLVPDNWIYIQEREVKVGRLQIFNNWSPYMVSDLKKSG